MLEFKVDYPGIENNMIYCLGLFSTPPMSLNVNPGVNFKVWMDMYVNMMANEPAFKDMRGFMWWTSGYADEETIRWLGKLFRHYAIEGKTEMLSNDPYILNHIQNPDFNAGTTGWTLTLAEPGSIQAKSYSGYGALQGRVSWSSEGDNFLSMTRSSAGPNIFSQQITNLQTNRMYSMKMFTFDYADLVGGATNTDTFVVKIEIDNVDVDAAKSFQHVTGSRAKGVNYHWVVFRALGTTATLSVSDWESDIVPGGPIGQELIYNFIEIQPYLEN